MLTSVEAAVTEVMDAWGGINVIVNNAGIVRDAQLVKVKNGEVVATMSDEAFAIHGKNLAAKGAEFMALLDGPPEIVVLDEI